MEPIVCLYCNNSAVPWLYRSPVTDRPYYAAECTHCHAKWIVSWMRVKDWRKWVDSSPTNFRQSRVVEIKDG